MSIDATRATWTLSGITAPQKLILLSLADRAGETAECWPSLRRLMADTNLDRKTLIEHRKNLIDKGLIIYTGEMRGRTNSVPVMKLTYVKPREDYEESERKNGTASPISSPKNGTGSSPKNGTAKQSQKRDTESKILNLKEEAVESTATAAFSEEEKLRQEVLSSQELLSIFSEKCLGEKYRNLEGILNNCIAYRSSKGKETTFLHFKSWLINEKSVAASNNQMLSQNVPVSHGIVYHVQLSETQKYMQHVDVLKSDMRFKINGRDENTKIPTFEEWKQDEIEKLQGTLRNQRH